MRVLDEAEADERLRDPAGEHPARRGGDELREDARRDRDDEQREHRVDDRVVERRVVVRDREHRAERAEHHGRRRERHQDLLERRRAEQHGDAEQPDDRVRQADVVPLHGEEVDEVHHQQQRHEAAGGEVEREQRVLLDGVVQRDDVAVQRAHGFSSL